MRGAILFAIFFLTIALIMARAKSFSGGRFFGAILLAAFVAGVFAHSWVEVPAGHVGTVYDPFAGGIQDVVGHGCQRPSDGNKVVQTEKVAAGHPQQLEALPAPQPALVPVLEGRTPMKVGQNVDGGRVTHAQLGEGPAGRGERSQRLAQTYVALEALAQVGVGFGQALEGDRRRRW